MNNNADHNRKLLYEIFNHSGITVGAEKYKDFMMFLEDPANTHYLQFFFILCSGKYGFPEAHDRIVDMIKELEFQHDNYSYSQLFRINEQWYEFFKENAVPTGQRRSTDDLRRGVDKKYVDDVSLLNERLNLSIDESIRWITQLKLRHLMSSSFKK